MTRSTRLAPDDRRDRRAARGAVTPRPPSWSPGTLRRMVVDGQLTDGDSLPNEAELMAHLRVSRPTLREAVRVLESERLVEVRRGSRTGARVRCARAREVARPAGLLLELSGATIADLLTAKAGIEPLAARLLAESGSAEAFAELDALLEDLVAQGCESDRWPRTPAPSIWVGAALGNTTLSIVAGMLHEITVRHTAFVVQRAQALSKADYDNLIRTYRKLMTYLRAGDAAGAEQHWRQAPRRIAELLLTGLESVPIRDVMG